MFIDYTFHIYSIQSRLLAKAIRNQFFDQQKKLGLSINIIPKHNKIFFTVEISIYTMASLRAAFMQTFTPNNPYHSLFNIFSGVGTWLFNNDDLNLTSDEVKSQSQSNKNCPSTNRMSPVCRNKRKFKTQLQHETMSLHKLLDEKYSDFYQEQGWTHILEIIAEEDEYHKQDKDDIETVISLSFDHEQLFESRSTLNASNQDEQEL